MIINCHFSEKFINVEGLQIPAHRGYYYEEESVWNSFTETVLLVLERWVRKRFRKWGMIAS